MFRFYTSPEKITETCAQLEKEEINHIKNVLRMEKGDHIIVCDGCGNDLECAISEINNENIFAEIISRKRSEGELDAKITLFQGLPKKDKMELIIQKAVELGAYEIIPVETAHTVVKIDSKKEEKVVARWNSIAQAAAKQSHRGIIPNVGNILKFDKAIQLAANMDASIIPYERAKGIEESRKIFSSVKECKKIAVFIGPEGGFSEQEIERALNNGIKPITLGHRILRTETAGLTTLSIIMFELEKDGNNND